LFVRPPLEERSPTLKALYDGKGCIVSELRPHSVGWLDLPRSAWLRSASCAWAQVNIAVDSYGPVTDNAQSVFERPRPNISPHQEEITATSASTRTSCAANTILKPTTRRQHLQANGQAVADRYAVVGATTMIFSLDHPAARQAGLLHLKLTDAPVLLGFICGGGGSGSRARRCQA